MFTLPQEWTDVLQSLAIIIIALALRGKENKK